MTRRRLAPVLFTAALVLAACGGSESTEDSADVDPAASTADDPGSNESDDVEPERDSDSTDADDASSEAGSSVDGADDGSDDVSDGAGTLGAPLTPTWSVPVNGVALGATVAMSPDGTRVAFMTGGIQPMIQIHDAATGEILNSAEYHGQGLELVWTLDDQLVSWDAERLHLLDAATLTYPGGADLTVEPGAEECPTSVFTVRFDRSAGAMFISDFHDTGTIVCRLDIDAATISSTIIEGQGGPSALFFRPETLELVVAYSAESISGTDSVAVLDAATLEVKSAGPTPNGEPVSAATATDLVIATDQFTDSLASTGQPIAAQASGDRFGGVLLGTDGGQLVVMDAATGTAIASGAEGFRPLDGTDDGSSIVVLLQDALALYQLG